MRSSTDVVAAAVGWTWDRRGRGAEQRLGGLVARRWTDQRAALLARRSAGRGSVRPASTAARVPGDELRRRIWRAAYGSWWQPRPWVDSGIDQRNVSSGAWLRAILVWRPIRTECYSGSHNDSPPGSQYAYVHRSAPVRLGYFAAGSCSAEDGGREWRASFSSAADHHDAETDDRS